MISFDTLDTEPLFNRLQDFLKETNREMVSELRIIARNLAVSLAYATYPVGFDGNARDQGRIAVSRDISKLFTTASSFYSEIEEEDPALAAAFWKAKKENDPNAMRRVIAKTTFSAEVVRSVSPSRHQSSRNRRGRVTGSHQAHIVLDADGLREYKRDISARSGMSKAGWAAAASEAGGTNGIPAWASITGHPQATGGASETLTPDGLVITIYNSTPWITDILHPTLYLRALEIAQRNLITRMNIVTQKLSDDPF